MLAAALRVVERDSLSDSGVLTMNKKGALLVAGRWSSILSLLKVENSNWVGSCLRIAIDVGFG
jgi:hypothetical protein